MPTPKALDKYQAARTLAARLAPRADRLRQLATRLGIRPYRCWLVWTRYGGEERGEGDELEIQRIELLPTPKVADLTGIQFNPYSGGVLPAGSIRVDRISCARYTEDILRGRVPPGSPHIGQSIEEPNDFFWEITFDGRNEGGTFRPRGKYRLVGNPWLNPGNAEYAVILERISEDRSSTGLSNIGDDNP